MAIENVALDGTASGSGTNTAGTDTNINDDDTDTYYGGGDGGYLGAGSWNYEDIITLDKTYNLTKIEIFHLYQIHFRGGDAAELEYWVDVYYDSSWHNVLHQTFSSEADNTTTVSDETGWNGVSKVRVRADGSWSSNEFEAYSTHHVYELRAYGSALDDSGIRIYNGSSNIKIGSEILDGHKLRFYNGSNIVGIPLLSTGDVEASVKRIFDGSGLTNMATDGSTNHTCSKTGDVVDSTTCANTYDGDINTAYKVDNYNGVNGTNTQIANITSEHTWSTPYHVIRARGLLYMYYYANGGSQGTNPEAWLTAQLFLKISGSWTKIKEYTQYLEQDHFTLSGSVYKDFDLYAGWDDVTGVKVFVESKNKGWVSENPIVHVYEAQAWVDTGGTVKALPEVS